MPTFRGIEISLQSQFDALKIPEYIPGSTPLSEHHSRKSTSSFSSFKVSPSKAAPKSIPPSVDLFIPSYPCSQFWICYACTPPPPGSDLRYFYFKLLAKGKCIASWGFGQRQGWCGKVMFVLYDGGKDANSERITEKKGFFFPPDGQENVGEGAFFELHIFRAKARRRDVARYEKMCHSGLVRGGMRLESTGEVKKGEPQRMYEYALKDPIERPYVTIRYHCRTSEQLDDLGCTTPAPPTPPPHSTETSPSDNSGPQTEALADEEEEDTPVTEPPPALRLTRRLSFPPTQQFHPQTTTNEPSSPQKQRTPCETETKLTTDDDDDSSTLPVSDNVLLAAAQRPVSRHDWAVERRSPVEQAGVGEFVGVGLLSPPKKTRKGSKSLLSGLVASATRRRARSATPESRRMI